MPCRCTCWVDDSRCFAQVVQLYAELAAGFESMITEDLINSPPDRAAAGGPVQQARGADRPSKSAQRSDTASPPQPDGPESRIVPDPPEGPAR